MSLYLSKQEVLDLEKSTLICVGKSKYLLCEVDEDSNIVRVDLCDFPVKKHNSKSVEYFFSEPKLSIVPSSFRIQSDFKTVSPTGLCDVLWEITGAEQKTITPNSTLLKNKNHLMALFLKAAQTHSNTEECLNILIWDNKLFLTYFKQGKLINANSYSVIDTKEIIYYTMLYVQEYQINQESAQVIIYGDLNSEGLLENELKPYFRNTITKRSNLINDPTVSGLVYLLTSTKL